MATTTTVQSVALPEWYNQYAQNVLGKAYASTGEAYQPYNAPRIAGFAPEQEQAFQLTQQGIGSYKPYLSQAQGLTQQATQGSGLAAAAPYLQQGTASFGSRIGEYMNPYIGSVVNRIGELSGRNLQENILPGLNRTFVGGGTFGGSRSADFMGRAVRDANEAALAEQSRALQAGYGQAADIFSGEAGRALQAAGTAGQLSSADLSRLLAAGAQMSDLGQQQQRMQGVDTAALAGIGGQRQALSQQSANLAYEDFQRQRDYPYEQVAKLANIGGTLQVPTAQSTTSPAPSQTAANVGSIIGGLGTLASAFTKKKAGGKVSAKRGR
jgi:hypothetical protein